MVGTDWARGMQRAAFWLSTPLALVLTLTACTVDRPSGSLPERGHRAQHTSAHPTHATTAQPGRADPKGPVSRHWTVVRVIDGDTVEVQNNGRDLTVRLIGIDTPETVHPTEPIECFGPEASSFAQRRLTNRIVTLEFDPTQGRRDYYGRTLAYIWTIGDRFQLFNLAAVRRGYALEYTYDSPYRWQAEFQRAESRARHGRLGVWQCPTPGS